MRHYFLLFLLPIIACNEPEVIREPLPYTGAILNEVSRPPAYFGLEDYYHKYLDADGIPIFSGIEIPELALQRVKRNVGLMLSGEEQLKRRLQDNYVRIVILALIDEMDTIPEFDGLHFAENQRSRPAEVNSAIMVIPEENILCFPNDPSEGEDVFVRTFALSLLQTAIPLIEPHYLDSLRLSYQQATQAGLWKNTLASQSVEDYFAEGVQNWFDVNLQAEPADGRHNLVDNRIELAAYDPNLYRLLLRFFPEVGDLDSCSL